MVNPEINQEEEQENLPLLSEKEQVENALALIPENEKLDIKKVLTAADLVKIGTHKKTLSSFKRRFGKLAFTSLDDKKTRETVEDAVRTMRSWRTDLDNERKKLIAPMNAGVKFVNSNYNPVIEDCKTVEEPVKNLKKYWEEQEQAAKNLEAELLAKKEYERVDRLIKAGAVFDENYYSIGSDKYNVPFITIGVLDIKGLTDVLFEEILGQVVIKNQIITEAKQKEEEEQKIVEQQRLERERLNKEQFQKDQEKLLEDQRKLDEQKKQQEDEMAELRQQRLEMRSGALLNLGFGWHKETGNLAYESQVVLVNYIENCSKSEWDSLLSEMQVTVAKLKEADAIAAKRKADKDALIALRLSDISALGMNLNQSTNLYEAYGIKLDGKIDNIVNVTPEIWNQTIDKTKALIADAKKLAEKAISDKAIEDKRIADLAEEKRKKDELAAADDKTKWESFVDYLKKRPVIEMQSDEYKKLLAASTDAINTIIKAII